MTRAAVLARAGSAMLATVWLVPAAAAQWSSTPAAQLHVLNETNPRLLADEDPQVRAVQAAVAAASLSLDRTTELSDAGLEARISQRRYRHEPELDRTDAHAGASIRGRRERLDWSAQLSAARDTTLTSELGGSGISTRKYRHETVGGTLQAGWSATERLAWDAGGGVQFDGYPGSDDSTLVDFRYRHAQAGASYLLSRQSVLAITMRGAELAASGSDYRSTETSLQVQYRLQPRESVSLSFFAGPSWVKGRGRARVRGEGLGITAGLRGQHISTELSARRSVAPTGRGVLSERDTASVGLQMQLREHLHGGVTAAYIRSKDILSGFGLELSDVRYRQVGATLDWRPSPAWSAGVGAGYADQLTRRQAGAAHGFTVQAGVTWRGGEHVW